MASLFSCAGCLSMIFDSIHRFLLAGLDVGYSTPMRPPNLSLDRLTKDQRLRLADCWTSICHRYPDETSAEDIELRKVAYRAAYEYLIGALTVHGAGVSLRRTRAQDSIATAVARQVAILSVADGMPETKASIELGIDRMTVRRWRHQEV